MPKGSANGLIIYASLAHRLQLPILRMMRPYVRPQKRLIRTEWILMQDTDWEGYRLIPCEIMQGYTTMALEAAEQMEDRPTHIFLQAGVGAMSGALTGFFANLYGDDLDAPRIIIVEPQAADCIFRTAAADDGELYAMYRKARHDYGWPRLRDTMSDGMGSDSRPRGLLYRNSRAVRRTECAFWGILWQEIQQLFQASQVLPDSAALRIFSDNLILRSLKINWTWTAAAVFCAFRQKGRPMKKDTRISSGTGNSSRIKRTETRFRLRPQSR